MMAAGRLIGGPLALLVLLLACGRPAAAQDGANSTAFQECLQVIGTDQAVFPDDGAVYKEASAVFNSRFWSPEPAAVFYAYTPEEVSAALQCAAEAGVKVSPAGGRQSLQGYTVPKGYLVVDVSNMTEISISSDNSTLSVGAGASNIMVQAAIYDSGIPGAAVPSGVCSYVGVSGWTLGGGFGLFGRYLGLGCDNLVGLEMVLANGTVVYASADENVDLFWASCGAGGGTWGVATRFDFKISELPNEGRVVQIAITYAPGANNTAAAYSNFQKAIPTLDNRFGFLPQFSNGRFTLSGIFFGTLDEAVAGMKEAGILEYLDPESVSGPDNSQAYEEVPFGMQAAEQPTYFAFATPTAIQWTSSATTPAGPAPWGTSQDAFFPTPENYGFLNAAVRGEKGYQVVGGQGFNMFLNNQARLVGELPEEGVQALAEFVDKIAQDCKDNGPVASTCYYVVSGHVLGGAYADKAADATAYPHRDALILLDGGVGVPTSIIAENGGPENPFVAGLIKQGMQWTDEFSTTITPYLGDQPAAYVNYLSPIEDNWQAAYFGSNYERLQKIKTVYDPNGLFSKPYTVEVLSDSEDATTSAATPRASLRWWAATAAAAVAAAVAMLA